MSAILLSALVWQVVDFLRELANLKTHKSDVITQATAWLGGVVIILLCSHATVAAGIVVPGFTAPIGGLDVGSQILLGLVVASLGSSLVDVKQALDSTDSAAKPPLVKAPAPGP